MQERKDVATKERIDFLKVIPCCNKHVKAKQRGETIALSFPRLKRSWMSHYLLPKGMSKDIYAYLEEHGIVVWNLIDGQRMVRKITEKLADHSQYETGYKSRVSTYLSQLQKDGLIRWIID